MKPKLHRYTAAGFLALILGLAACSPSTPPAPATAPAPAPAPQAPTEAPAPETTPTESPRSSIPETPVSPATPSATIDPCQATSQHAYDYKRLHACIDSLAQAGNFNDAIALLQLQIDNRNNPDQLGRRTLQLARYLDAQGRNREAAKVLENFLVYKPALNEWMDSASNLESQFQAARETQKNSYSSLIKQIRNLGAVGADYDQLRLLTDSLRSLQPGDSLVQWSLSQDAQAFQRSLGTLRKKIQEVRTQVLDNASFAEAAKTTDALLLKYPSLTDTTGLRALRSWISEQEKLYAQNADAAYWSNHDPRSSLKEARALLERKQYNEARALYQKLLSSPQRKEAREDLEILSEAFCEGQRKIAADRFAAARRTPKNAAANLSEAIAALDRCLNDYPDTEVAAKVRQNRALLEQEKAKLKSESP